MYFAAYIQLCAKSVIRLTEVVRLLKTNVVDSLEMENKAIEALREAKMPASIEYVARKTGLAWHQARSLLFRLAAEDKVSMLNTTKSWVFMLREWS